MLKPDRHSEICANLKVWPEILDTRQLQRLLATQSWGETNTRKCDPGLWPKPRIARLPEEDALIVYNHLIPLSAPHSSNYAAKCLTTKEGLKRILEIMTKHQIPITETSPCNSPDPFLHCPQHEEYRTGVFIPFSFTGDDMGDGNMLIYIQVIVFEEPIYAIPLVAAKYTTEKKQLDARHEYRQDSWTLENRTSEKVKFDARAYSVCRTHRPKAKELLLRLLQMEQASLSGIKRFSLPDKNFYWNEAGTPDVGELIKELISHKIRLYPAGKPVCLFDPIWLNNS